MSLRFRTSRSELMKIAPRQYKKGATAEIRMAIAIKHKKKVRLVRQIQQSERGLVEFPFGLFSGSDRIKTVCMSERDAAERNKNIAGLGMVWRRCGY